MKFQTLSVLWYVLNRLLLVMAPVNPMLTEEIYQQIFKKRLGNKAKKSIHLESWPKIDKKYIDKSIETQMSFARLVVDTVRTIKSEFLLKGEKNESKSSRYNCPNFGNNPWIFQ